jgi:adenylate cyclase class 2
MHSVSKTGLRKSARRAGKKSNMEIEVKLRIGDRRGFLRQLARLKAKRTRARVHEMNTLYDTTDGQLARRGQMLRLRVERPAGRARTAGRGTKSAKSAKDRPASTGVLTFKGPVNGAETNSPEPYKVREEHELRIASPEEMPKIFEALSLRPCFRYEKYRTTFSLPGMTQLKLTLDETPIGLFVELEGEREEIDRAAGLLGFARSDYINKSYGALFVEERGLAGPASGKEPTSLSGITDMLFRS